MKLRDFTKPEINKIIELSNFTSDELQYFNLKASDMSNIQIAIKMNISESQVSKLARRVKAKIIRVI